MATTATTDMTTSLGEAQLTDADTYSASDIDALAARGAHLIQLTASGTADLYATWVADEPCYYPAVDRNAGDIRDEDLVLFWVAGPGERAGIIGFGLATGLIEDREHPRAYPRLSSPVVLRPSAEVGLGWVSPSPIISRSLLRQHPAFEQFDLFTMPNRPNAFPVTPEQALAVINLLREVMG